MKKIWDSIAKDLWIVLLDIIAVNAAYIVALLLRFDFRYSQIPEYYLGAFLHFAPIYTIFCIFVFSICWRTKRLLP